MQWKILLGVFSLCVLVGLNTAFYVYLGGYELKSFQFHTIHSLADQIILTAVILTDLTVVFAFMMMWFKELDWKCLPPPPPHPKEHVKTKLEPIDWICPLRDPESDF